MTSQSNNKRVLIGNIYYSPSSFGGATVVAENLALKLKERHGWDPIIVTSLQDAEILPYMMRRYSTHGIDVIGVRLPDIHPFSPNAWSNAEFDRVFGEIVEAVQPDVVHLHSIQNMGVGIIGEVKKRGIPLAITVHDYWFLCERQFMINHMGRFCDQKVIDPSVCRYCVIDINETKRRSAMLRHELSMADRILFPSAYHRDFHIANGVLAERCVVNKNGVRPPLPGYRRAPNATPDKHKLRFGFVGGPGPIKGASLLAKAFARLGRSDFSLTVVDAARNIGVSWEHDPVWMDFPGDIRFVAPYDQDTIDAFFSKIDVLLFASQWKESFGLTVREAMLRGVWVLATDAGGLSEDCVDGQNATVIPMDGNVETLANALRGLFENEVPVKRPIDHISTIDDQASELDAILRNMIEVRGTSADRWARLPVTGRKAGGTAIGKNAIKARRRASA
jgi:glycosyltransferase involved in cell wall biosynthesis